MRPRQQRRPHKRQGGLQLKRCAFAIVIIAAIVPASRTARAQATVPRTITGSVYDSVAQRPLSGARVHIADLARDATSDSLGGFRFDSVGPGVYTLWADHPTLDSLGLYALGARVDTKLGDVVGVTLAVPSLATLWRAACGPDTARPSGAGFVFGRVNAGPSARVESVPSVVATWRGADDADRNATLSVRPSAVPTDSAGNYAICGVPAYAVVTLSVVEGDASTVPVSFRSGSAGVTRRDLTLPSGATFERILADSSTVAPLLGGDAGMIAGIVRDSTGEPLRDARIDVSGVRGEWRADARGAFSVRGVAPGTHVVTVSTLGYAAERRIVDLMERDSASLDLSLSRLITTLGVVRINEHAHLNAVKADIESRRLLGFGYRADSTEIARLPGVMEAFNFPSVHTQWKQGSWQVFMQRGAYGIGSKGSSGLAMTCYPTIWIDGAIASMDYLNELAKDEIGLIEVYTSAAGAPLEFTGARTLCGTVLVWRKAFLNL